MYQDYLVSDTNKSRAKELLSAQQQDPCKTKADWRAEEKQPIKGARPRLANRYYISNKPLLGEDVLFCVSEEKDNWLCQHTEYVYAPWQVEDYCWHSRRQCVQDGQDNGSSQDLSAGQKKTCRPGASDVTQPQAIKGKVANETKTGFRDASDASALAQSQAPQREVADETKNALPGASDAPICTCTTTHSTPTPSPFDDGIVSKFKPSNEIPPKFAFQLLREIINGKDALCSAYFPDNFKAQDYETIAGVENEAAVLFHQLYLFRHIHAQGADEYVSFSWDYGRELIGQWKFDRLMKTLLNANILERVEIKEDTYGLGVWIPRGKGTELAFGYRFVNPDYRRNYSRVIIASKTLKRRLDRVRKKLRYPVQKHLERMHQELQAVETTDAELFATAEGDHAKAVALKEQLQAVRDKKLFFVPDDQRRLYSNLTNIKRGARRFLRVRGEPLWLVDLPCCHLLALACLCVKAGVPEAEDFMYYCTHDFYQQLADEGEFTRQQVKQEFTQRALNAPNSHRYQRSPVMQFFRRRWPHVARYMRQQKANGKPTKDCPKPHNRLALALQRWEANLVIFRICDRIRRERPDIWLGTIHDAVACLERDVPFVVSITEEELKTLGITLAPGKFAGKPM